MRHEITIPGWRPTPLNKLMFAKVNASIKLRKADAEIIGVYAHLAKIPNATTKRRVSLLVNLKGRQRELDVDSLWKSTLDGLVACGQLVGDNGTWCELGTVTYSREAPPQSVIILEDC